MSGPFQPCQLDRHLCAHDGVVEDQASVGLDAAALRALEDVGEDERRYILAAGLAHRACNRRLDDLLDLLVGDLEFRRDRVGEDLARGETEGVAGVYGGSIHALDNRRGVAYR